MIVLIDPVGQKQKCVTLKIPGEGQIIHYVVVKSSHLGDLLLSDILKSFHKQTCVN